MRRADWFGAGVLLVCAALWLVFLSSVTGQGWGALLWQPWHTFVWQPIEFLRALVGG